MEAERKFSRLVIIAIVIFVALFTAYTARADDATYMYMYSQCELADGTEAVVKIEMLANTKVIPTAEAYGEYVQRVCSHYTVDEQERLLKRLKSSAANRLQMPASSVITNITVMH